MAKSKAPDFWERKFGHYNITWKIENFCIACCEENWRLQSPVLNISGHQMTKWMMILSPKVKRNKRYAVISLRRLKSDKGPDVAWAQWRSWVRLFDTNKEEKEYYLSENEHIFRKGDVFESDYMLLNQLYFYLRPFIHDVFMIRCLLVIQPEYNDLSIYNKPTNIHFSALSEALSSLVEDGKDHDMVLDTEIAKIRVHKAILHYRNKTLAEKIEKECKDGTLDFSQMSYEAVINIVNYLYSGSLEHILQRPTIATEELALDFRVDEIKKCYILDKLFIDSKYAVDEYSVDWIIENYSSKHQVFCSSPIMRGTMNFSWRLYIFPNALDDNENVSIFFFFVKGTVPKSLCIEISILNDRKEYIQTKRKCKSFLKEEPFLGFENFIKKDVLRVALVKDTLLIRFKLLTSLSSAWFSSSFYDNDLNSRTNIDPYENLSSDLATMLQDGKFGDIILQVGEDSFKAHKCILSARSALTQRTTDGTTVIPDMEPHILRSILHYIYTGVLKDYDLKDVFTIYNAADTFVIPTLTSLCSSILAQNLNLQSVTDVLQFAMEKNDKLLKNSSIAFVSQNADQVFKDEKWKKLIFEKPLLSFEVENYMKNKSKKSLTLKERFGLLFRRK